MSSSTETDDIVIAKEEWYTPAEYVEAARRTMGGIDCDPASCAIANKTVRASIYYTRADNGLTKPWRGRVWLNPPYTANVVDQFADALIAKYQSGETTQACMLTNNSFSARWCQHVLAASSAVCILGRRISFIGRTTGQPFIGQSIFYFGKTPLAFVAVFRRRGIVVVDPVRVGLVYSADGWRSNGGQAYDECRALADELRRQRAVEQEAQFVRHYGDRTIFDPQ